METIKHFKELKVWQKGIEIVKDTKMNFINEKPDHTSKMLSSLISKLR